MNTMKLPLLLTVMAWALLVLAMPSAQAATDDALPPAGQFIQKLGDKALLELTDKSLDASAREKRARKLLTEYFDVPYLARFALGPYWRTATDKQKSEYTSLFEDMIVKTYAARFEDYAGQSFKVTKARDENGKVYVVMSQIIQEGGPPVQVDWHVRGKGNSMKVVDVYVENISMGITQRDDFSSVIQGAGGNVDALLDSLRKRQEMAKN